MFMSPTKQTSTERLFMLLLLTYHRHLRMISEAQELRVEGRWVSHSWCMCVISHGYGGLFKVSDGGVGC